MFDPERAPVRLSHYVLLNKLGHGGMGVVYAAYDERLDRRVAIKLLRKRERERAKLRLIREAQALARLSHPNVVQIYEIGEVDQHTFLVMELLDGVTLGQARAEHKRTRAELLELFTAAGRGLAAAHAKGLIHRDFKPDNVMICADGRVVVMDFGLARGDERGDPGEAVDTEPEPPVEPATEGSLADELVLESPSPGSGSGSSVRSSELERILTRAGTIMGTPGYMAPEQLLGAAVSDRCDQFSFCVTLWEALYDRRPFAGRTLEGYARAVLAKGPKPGEPNDVPPWLRKVLERGLAREPADRWPSMNELLDALQRDPTRRRRRLAASAGLLACTVVAAVAIQIANRSERERVDQQRADQIAACEREAEVIAADWNDEVAAAIERAFLATGHPFASSAWQHTRPWLDGYARDWSAVRAQTCVEATVERTRGADSQAAVAECLDEGRIAFVGVLDVLAGLTADDAQMVTSATLTAARLSPPSSCTHESLLRQARRPPAELREAIAGLRTRLERARARSYAGDHARALDEAQAVLAEAEAPGWDPLLVQAGSLVAFAQFRLGKYEDARRSAEQAFLTAAASDDELGMLLAAAELATVLGTGLARDDDARRWVTLAKALVDRLELGGTTYEAQVLTRLATLLSEAGADAEALPHQQRALQIYEEVLGPEHPTVALVLLNLGIAQDRLGQPRAALASYQRGIEIVTAVQGPEHSNLGYLHNSVGTTLGNIGDLEGALVAYQRALAIWEPALGSEHPTVALAQTNMGSLLCRKGRGDEGLTLHRRALATLEAKQGAEHPQVGTTHRRIGRCLQELDSLDEALAAYRRALAILESSKGAEHPYVLDTQLDIGAVLREQGHASQAVEQFRLTLAVIERIDGSAPTLRTGLVELGLALLDAGDVAAACEQLERAVPLFEQDGGVDRARARLSLAQALSAAGERARAQTLIDEARADYLAAGEFGARGLAQLDAWAREHP